MISNLSAEFSSPEHAGDAIRKVRNSVRGVYSATIRPHPVSVSPVLHMAITDASFTSGIPDTTRQSPVQRSGATVYIVCELGCAEDISSILSNLGAKKIQFSHNCSPS